VKGTDRPEGSPDLCCGRALSTRLGKLWSHHWPDQDGPMLHGSPSRSGRGVNVRDRPAVVAAVVVRAASVAAGTRSLGSSGRRRRWRSLRRPPHVGLNRRCRSLTSQPGRIKLTVPVTAPDKNSDYIRRDRDWRRHRRSARIDDGVLHAATPLRPETDTAGEGCEVPADRAAVSRPADLRAWIAGVESVGDIQHVGANRDPEIGIRRPPPSDGRVAPCGSRNRAILTRRHHQDTTRCCP